MEAGFIYKLREILTMWRVSGRWSPKYGSLARDAGDLVGLVKCGHWDVQICGFFGPENDKT